MCYGRLWITRSWVKGVQLAMDIRNRWHGMKILVSLNSKFVKYNYSALGHSYSGGNRVKERVYKERLVGLLILVSPSKRPGPPLAIHLCCFRHRNYRRGGVQTRLVSIFARTLIKITSQYQQKRRSRSIYSHSLGPSLPIAIGFLDNVGTLFSSGTSEPRGSRLGTCIGGTYLE